MDRSLNTKYISQRSQKFQNVQTNWNGTEQYSEAFDPDDPTLMDRYPTYDTDTDLGDGPSTPTHNDRYVSSYMPDENRQSTSLYESNLFAIPTEGSRT